MRLREGVKREMRLRKEGQARDEAEEGGLGPERYENRPRLCDRSAADPFTLARE